MGINALTNDAMDQRIFAFRIKRTCSVLRSTYRQVPPSSARSHGHRIGVEIELSHSCCNPTFDSIVHRHPILHLKIIQGFRICTCIDQLNIEDGGEFALR